MPFVAEVKCNIPVNGADKYGAAQRAGILKDVAALREGKLKAGGVLPQSLKFMVFLDPPEVRRANEHRIQSNSTAMHFLSSGEVPSDPTVVYGVYVPLGD